MASFGLPLILFLGTFPFLFFFSFPADYRLSTCPLLSRLIFHLPVSPGYILPLVPSSPVLRPLLVLKNVLRDGIDQHEVRHLPEDAERTQTQGDEGGVTERPRSGRNKREMDERPAARLPRTLFHPPPPRTDDHTPAPGTIFPSREASSTHIHFLPDRQQHGA